MRQQLPFWLLRSKPCGVLRRATGVYMMRFVGILSILFILAGCSFATPSARENGHYISEKYAKYRAELISDVSYVFTIDLTKDNEFSGTSKIEFIASHKKPVSVDFAQGAVKAIRANGKPVAKIEYNGNFISLSEESINKGHNTLEIEFTHEYSKTGSGLYRFVDPEDKKVYLYSDFEPYDANLFVPCFDQPDLKATYEAQVTAPAAWTVVSSVRETKVDKKGELAVWTFPKTKKFSTYVYSLHAGPYKVWESSVKTEAHTLPLRLMARQSLAKYVDTKEWFTTTQQGFQFFEKYFVYAYPFEKYDQVIVPDFNSGAMENVGAVTFNENRYISRGKKSHIEKRMLAGTILHEMAHMWFGDLVTMQWWNDIWLNESFATYAATLAYASTHSYEDAWVSFNERSKGSAYWEDQLVTTHPITFKVPNTDVVFANFDGITYGKGASVLKQLHFYLGDNAFQKGLQSYFSTYAFNNTRLDDFIGALAKAGEKDLKKWEHDWLEKAQVNTVKAELTCEEGKVKSLDLLQTAPKDYPTLRTHKTKVAFFSVDNGDLKLLKDADVTYNDSKTTVTDFNGMNCDAVQFIHPNYGDYDYVKIAFDTKSLQTIRDHVASFKDEMIQVTAWRSLWEMVVDEHLNGLDYLQVFYAQAAQEKSADILSSILEHSFSLVENVYPRRGSWEEKYKKEKEHFAAFIFDNMKIAKEADVQRVWVSFMDLATTAEQLTLLKQMAAGQTPKWLRYPLDQDMRWNAVVALAKNGVQGIMDTITTESKRDTSARGELRALQAQAAIPDIKEKERFINILAKGPTASMPVGKLRYIAESLFPFNQETLHEQFADRFYTDLKNLKSAPVEYLSLYTYLVPSFCSANRAKSMTEFVSAEEKDFPANVIKRLRVSAQLTDRCVQMRAKMEGGKAADPA